MSTTTQSYRPTLNAGQVYLRPAGSDAPLKAIGNVSALDLEISEEEKTLTDYTQPGGGQWASVSRITAVSAKMTLHDLDPDNLARAVYGTTNAVTGASVSGEAHRAHPGGLIRLAHPGPSAVVLRSAAAPWSGETAIALGAYVEAGGALFAATTAGTTGVGEPSWPGGEGETVSDGSVTWTHRGAFAAVAGTDYEVRPEGVLILDGAIPAGCPLLIDYSHDGYDAVEALTGGGAVYELSFGGLNEANSNSPVVLDIFRLKIGAATNLSMLGAEFAALEVIGKVLLDPTKTGAGRSRYFRVQMV
ncbi:hypothetical protein [Marichromatium gracile]|uniref:Uncharacterized protein n=1 Tax=Marichromatium gracile TaxID=1048 RepID=A0A4R4ABA5_MARGR|nr:hypothetical protein [Marichromatium gracile]MBK1710578.1 hypothetical protein [Marichromatium gracile]MBO8085768.1 hypothetical protein [Marichromatium sp.]TCW36291.1 hypothetical protein EDC29_10474 [Marichromatium gracile]